MTGGLALAIRLRFHNHAPKEVAIGLAFHQQAANELGGNLLGGAGEEGLGEVLRGRGGYGSGLGGRRSLRFLYFKQKNKRNRHIMKKVDIASCANRQHCQLGLPGYLLQSLC